MRLFYDEFGATGVTIILTGIIVIELVCVGLISVGNAFASAACVQHGEMTGRETVYKFPAGCFVRSDGRFIPVDEFNARAITNERGRE